MASKEERSEAEVEKAKILRNIAEVRERKARIRLDKTLNALDKVLSPLINGKRPISEKTREFRSANMKNINATGQVIRPSKDRPARTPLREMLSTLLYEQGDNQEPAAIAYGILNALVAKAMTGDTKAIDMILDRVDGKVSQKVEVESEKPLACLVLPEKESKSIDGDDIVGD